MFDERSPIYQQVADQVKQDILRGALQADEPVMSTNQFATHYRINPATAAKGLHQLVDDGLLYKRRGIGMFVAADARERLLAQRREQFFAERVQPVLAEAELLGIGSGEIIEYLRNHSRPSGSAPAGLDPSRASARPNHGSA